MLSVSMTFNVMEIFLLLRFICLHLSNPNLFIIGKSILNFGCVPQLLAAGVPRLSSRRWIALVMAQSPVDKFVSTKQQIKFLLPGPKDR